MDFIWSWLQVKGPLPSKLIMSLFARFTLVPWISKNKMTIEKRFPNAPADVIYIALSCMPKWNILLKEVDREWIHQVTDEIEIMRAG